MTNHDNWVQPPEVWDDTDEEDEDDTDYEDEYWEARYEKEKQGDW